MTERALRNMVMVNLITTPALRSPVQKSVLLPQYSAPVQLQAYQDVMKTKREY